MLGKHGSRAGITCGTSRPLRLCVCFGLCWLPGQQKLVFLSTLTEADSVDMDTKRPVTFLSLGNAPTKRPQNLPQFLAREG